MDGFSQVPIINISTLVGEASNYEDCRPVAEQIRSACRDWGFFYVTGHGVDDALQERLEWLSRQFFVQSP
jgi:isopenicillin N synthase-like dioxygenase